MEDVNRRNNFDFLRLLFASIVVLFHCYDLSLNPKYNWIVHIASGSLAVQGFFAMSGFLIVASYERTRTIREYFAKRARRILPAYLAALILTIIIGIIFSSLLASTFLKSSSTWKYIFANISFANFLHPTLPGLFAKNRVTTAVNGSLWTIKIEVMFYLIVPLMVMACRKLGRWQVLSGIFATSLLYQIACDHFNHPTLASQLPGQMCYFTVGTFVYYYYIWFKRNAHWMWLLVACSGVIYFLCGSIASRAIGVSLGTMCVGLLLPWLIQPTKYGDLSYGIYVYHFPIIQLFIASELINHHPNLSIGLIAIIIFFLAVVSWNFLEKPCLERNRIRKELGPHTPV